MWRGGRFSCIDWEDEGKNWFQHRPFTQEEREKTTHAHLYLNETRLFVETRSVTQMGKCVLSEHIHTPTKTDTDKQDAHRQAGRATLLRNTPAISSMSLI